MSTKPSSSGVTIVTRFKFRDLAPSFKGLSAANPNPTFADLRGADLYLQVCRGAHSKITARRRVGIVTNSHHQEFFFWDFEKTPKRQNPVFKKPPIKKSISIGVLESLAKGKMEASRTSKIAWTVARSHESALQKKTARSRKRE